MENMFSGKPCPGCDSGKTRMYGWDKSFLMICIWCSLLTKWKNEQGELVLDSYLGKVNPDMRRKEDHEEEPTR